MKKPILNIVSYSVLTILSLHNFSWANEVASGVSMASVDGGGRNIMRTADGGIVAAFSATAGALVFSRSLNNGRTWNNVPLKTVKGSVIQTAIDSNFQGSYIAFTEQINGKTVGRVAYSSAPFSDKPKLTVSQPVTPDGIIPQDTFVQASRAGWGNLAADNRETVVYGWQDALSKGLYIGVSQDGRTFPEAKLVLEDGFAKSGPAVAIRGNYVVASYQTMNPAMAPSDVQAKNRIGRSYPAWLESLDGGQTWSKPKPLFGLTSADFPSVKVDTGKGPALEYRLAGGSTLPNSPTLNWNYTTGNHLSRVPDKTLPIEGWPIEEWPIDKLLINQIERPFEEPPEEQPDKINIEQKLGDNSNPHAPLGGTTFVQTSMRSIDGDSQSEISIVSFRQIEPEAQWTHVIANNRLTASLSQVDRRTSMVDAQGLQFQYSALVDTAVRATTYQELDAKGRGRLVAAVSTDTGKTFNHHISFSNKELKAYGVNNFGKGAIFAVSQCLFEDRDGKVHVDIMFTHKGSLQFASLPLGVNAADLRAEEEALLVSLTH